FGISRVANFASSNKQRMLIIELGYPAKASRFGRSSSFWLLMAHGYVLSRILNVDDGYRYG
ncbi:MAG: hypothetical protein ACK53L_09795, partial [Pirellulaceae bacterium]